MEEILFQQVENDDQKEKAGALIREYLEWLNERVKHDYGIEFTSMLWLNPICQIPTSFFL